MAGDLRPGIFGVYAHKNTQLYDAITLLVFVTFTLTNLVDSLSTVPKLIWVVSNSRWYQCPQSDGYSPVDDVRDKRW